MFVTIMHKYYTNELLEEDVAHLLTRRTLLNTNHEEGHERLYTLWIIDYTTQMISTKGFV